MSGEFAVVPLGTETKRVARLKPCSGTPRRAHKLRSRPSKRRERFAGIGAALRLQRLLLLEARDHIALAIPIAP
jgi:hypothetical protein